jgi:hypothetical protein
VDLPLGIPTQDKPGSIDPSRDISDNFFWRRLQQFVKRNVDTGVNIKTVEQVVCSGPALSALTAYCGLDTEMPHFTLQLCGLSTGPREDCKDRCYAQASYLPDPPLRAQKIRA